MEHFDLKSKWHLEYFHTCKDNPSEYPFVRHISIYAVFLILHFHQSLREVAILLHHFYPDVRKSWCRKAACKMMRSRSRQINTNRAFGERRILGFFLIFITLFISPLWTWQWQIEKLKIQNLPRIQRQGYFSITSSISNSVPSIYSSAWLAKFLYHAQPCISLH